MHGPLETPTAHPQQAQGDVDRPDLLTQLQVCRRLGISDETWRRWRKRGLNVTPILAGGFAMGAAWLLKGRVSK